MIRPSVRLSPVIAAFLIARAGAQQATTQVPFRFERPVVSRGAGPARLAIDLPLVAAGAPFQVLSETTTGASGESTPIAVGGLKDLRLFDAGGREIAYLLVPSPPSDPDWRPAVILPIAPVDTPTEKSSGFEADLGIASMIDRFRLEGIAPPFLKRVRLEGSGDREHWTLLVDEGTVFDLPAEQLRQLELIFTAGSFRYLRLTWDDSNSGRLPRQPEAFARRIRAAEAEPPLTASLAFEQRPSEPGRSRYRIRLPASQLPIVGLQLDIDGGHLLREASIFEARLSGGEAVPTLLGRGTLRRVVQGALTASSLRVPISPPREAQVDLVVDDGNNAPLAVRGATAVFARLPWIYFESDGGAIAARYGNPALAAPKYDLEAVRPSLRIDSVPAAAWGEARARIESEAAGPAPLLPTVGASLDPSLFRYVRAIPPGAAGLVVLHLDAAALAHSAGAGQSFADVRVIDADGRQIPYLVERASEPLSIDLALEPLASLPSGLPESKSTRSGYRVAWPFERLPSPRLVLTTSARVFRRRISVAVPREPDERRREPWMEPVAAADWVHADQDIAAPALLLSLRPVATEELVVLVEEGDNSPLPLVTARLLLPAYRLRFFREAGAPLRLAYGRDDLSSPRYDLALLAPQLLGVAATEVAPGAEEPTAAAAAAGPLVSPWLFWGTLAIAVVVLLSLVVRLVRNQEAETL